MKKTPLLLQVPPGHVTFEMVERKFQEAWNHPNGDACPAIKHVYKVIESQSLLDVYDAYRHGFSTKYWVDFRILTIVAATNMAMNASDITGPGVNATLGIQVIQVSAILLRAQPAPFSEHLSK